MARVVKPADQRQAEILEAARRLFFARGYEGTSVNDLLDAVGISKGAFYHHFTSKDDVLAALAARLADDGVARLGPLIARADLTPLAKLQAVFADGQRFRREQITTLRPFFEVLFRDENVRLRLRVTAATIERVAPIVARVIAAGARAGEFAVDDPDETARLLLQMGTTVHEAFAHALALDATDRPGARALLRRRVAAYERAVERVLGAPKHSIAVLDDEMIDLFLGPAP